jgi:hypothetical protein
VAPIIAHYHGFRKVCTVDAESSVDATFKHAMRFFE